MNTPRLPSSMFNPDPSDPTVRPEQLVRSLYRALELRDLRLLGSMLADDVVWVTPDCSASDAVPVSQPDAIRGGDAALAWLTHLIEQSGGEFSVRLQRLYMHSPDRVAAFHESTLPSGGVRTECLLFEIDAGLVCRAVRLAPAASGPVRAPRL